MEEEVYYKQAKKIVKKKKSFYSNFISWAIMSVFFFILNMTTGAHFHWWIFPTLGWGIGVAFHYVDAFGVFKSKDWEQRAVQKEMNKLYRHDTRRSDYGELDLDKIPNREQYADTDFEELRKEWDDQEFV